MIIDGAHGEGGGQILRAALSLSAITGRPLRIERIRAARRIPGLAAQHLTALRAAAAICSAQLSGDTLGSTCVEFAPEGPIVAGNYVFDVSLAREGGSAGAVMLVLQTVLLPLAFAGGDSGSSSLAARTWRGARPSITSGTSGCHCSRGSASRPLSSSPPGAGIRLGKAMCLLGSKVWKDAGRCCSLWISRNANRYCASPGARSRQICRRISRSV